MDDKLYQYLKKEWKYNNHNKYQKYFEQWADNLTEIQVFNFTNQRLKSIGKQS